MKSSLKISCALTLALLAGGASAAPIYWADWTGTDQDPGVGFIGSGTITTPTSTVNVTYTNARGIAFYQTAGSTYYYSNGTDGPAGTSPYTSAQVDNRPPTNDIVALQYAGTQSLVFSQAIANPVFAYVSLNGNGYGFDQDFDILSFGDASDGNACGYWGWERTDLRQLLWLVQSEISRELGALRGDTAGKPPLRPVHEQILSLVGDRGQYMSDLVGGLSLPKQTVSDLVAELERSGFLQRISDPEHGVKKRVTLGTKGRKWLGQQHAYLDAVEKRWVKVVGKRELDALRATLLRLTRASDI